MRDASAPHAWTPVARLRGGTVATLLVTPGDGVPDVFAATLAGLFRCRAGNWRWRLAADDPAATRLQCLASLPGRPGLVFAGSADGVLVSADGGAGWRRLLDAPPVTGLVVGEGPTIVAGTFGDGCLRSSDGGATWQAANAGLLDLDVTALAAAPGVGSDRVVFAGTASGLYRSLNGGRSWIGVDLADGAEVPVEAIAVSPAFAADGTVWCGTDGHGAFVSRDSGITWHPAGAIHGGDTVSAIAAEADGAVAFAAGRQVTLHGDGAGSVPAPLPAPVTALAFTGAPQARLIAATAGAGAFVLDGGIWKPVNDDLDAVVVRRLAAAGPLLAAAGVDGVVHVSRDGGGSWSADPGFAAAGVADLAVAGSRIALLAEGGLWSPPEGEAGWLPLAAGLPVAVPTALAAAADASGFLAGFADGSVVGLSGNRAKPLGRPLPGPVVALADAGPANGPLVFAACRVGGVEVWRLRGREWSPCLDLGAAGPVRLAAAGGARGRLAVLAEGRILLATPDDDDLVWEVVELPGPVADIACAATPQGVGVFAATAAGLVWSADGGRSFVAAGGPAGTVTALAAADGGYGGAILAARMGGAIERFTP